MTDTLAKMSAHDTNGEWLLDDVFVVEAIGDPGADATKKREARDRLVRAWPGNGLEHGTMMRQHFKDGITRRWAYFNNTKMFMGRRSSRAPCLCVGPNHLPTCVHWTFPDAPGFGDIGPTGRWPAVWEGETEGPVSQKQPPAEHRTPRVHFLPRPRLVHIAPGDERGGGGDDPDVQAREDAPDGLRRLFERDACRAQADAEGGDASTKQIITKI